MPILGRQLNQMKVLHLTCCYIIKQFMMFQKEAFVNHIPSRLQHRSVFMGVDPPQLYHMCLRSEGEWELAAGGSEYFPLPSAKTGYHHLNHTQYGAVPCNLRPGLVCVMVQNKKGLPCRQAGGWISTLTQSDAFFLWNCIQFWII